MCNQIGFSGPPSLRELRSSGGAGEWQGWSCLGLYQLLLSGRGEGGKQGPVYQQLHNKSNQHYLYRWDIDN